MTLANSSIDTAPSTWVPLMKNVGVELDLELLDGALAHAFHGVPGLLILQAGVEALLGHAGLLGDRHQRRHRFFDRPGLLLAEECFHHGIIFVGVVVGGAMREHEDRARQIVEREIAQDIADLAGIDVALLDFRECGLLEMRAVRASHRGIFDDGDRRLGIAQRQIGHAFRIQKLGGGVICRQRPSREGRQRGNAKYGGCQRDGGGAQAELASGDMQLKLRWLKPWFGAALASSIP